MPSRAGSARALVSVLAAAPCDVALWFEREDRPTLTSDGPIFVPFGALEHDWAALELAAWLAAIRRPTAALAGERGPPQRRRAGREPDAG